MGIKLRTKVSNEILYWYCYHFNGTGDTGIIFFLNDTKCYLLQTQTLTIAHLSTLLKIIKMTCIVCVACVAFALTVSLKDTGYIAVSK